MSQEPSTGTQQAGQQSSAAHMPLPSVVRAEQLLTEWNQRARSLFGTARQHLQDTMGSMNTKAAEGAPSTVQGEEQGPPAIAETQPPQPVTERAELVVDDFAQRAEAFFARTSLQVQRCAAIAREDVEDIWAEAQSIHNRGRSPHQPM